MEEKLYWYKRNVPYSVAVRYFIGDVDGKVLTSNDPYVVIEEKNNRDFKRANRIAIRDGLIVGSVEPSDEMDSPNAIDDDKATELVKNFFVLKKTLKDLTSDAAVLKLLDEAKFQKRPQKTIDTINDRLRELIGETPDDMKGIVWDTQQE